MSLLISSALALAAATPATPRCPARHFAGFAKLFADDVAIQRKHVAFPLIDEHLDIDAGPEPVMVTRKLDARALQFPVMPNRAAREKDGLTLSTRALAGGDREVKLVQADSGYQIRYRFRPAGGCWQLVRRSDDSL